MVTDAEPPPRQRSLTAKTVRGFGWLASSSLIMAISRLLIIGILARLLTPGDFGIVAAAGIFIELARLMVTSGIVRTIVQREVIGQDDIDTVFTVALASGLIAAALLCLFAGVIADYFTMPQLRVVLYACSIMLPAVAASAVSGKLVEREHDFSRIAFAEMASYFAGIAIGVPLAFLGYGLWALVVPQIVGSFVRTGILLRAHGHRFRLRFNLASYRSLIKQGAGYSMQSYANLVATKGDYFVVGGALGPVQLGFYERAYTLMNLSNTLVGSALNTILFPAFSRIKDDNARLRAAFTRCHAMLAVIFLPLSTISVLLAQEIIAVLLGGQWGATVVPFQILVLGMFLRTAFKVAQPVLDAKGLVYKGLMVQASYAAAVVGGAWLLLPYGIIGVAVSTLIAIGLAYTALVAFVLRAIGMRAADLSATLFSAVPLTAAIGVVVWIVATGLRSVDSAPFVTLPLAAGAGVIGAALLILAFPGLIGRIALEFVRPHIIALRANSERRAISAFLLRRF